MIKKIAVLLLCCASGSLAAVCGKGMDPFKGGCAFVGEDGAEWRSEETPPRQRVHKWETGEETASMPAPQTWDSTTGGTEIDDKIKWAKAHPYVAPESIETGKAAGGGK